jgi:hypothetical protein
MYPQRELTRLAAHKAFLRRGIAVRRTQCAEAVGRATRPLEWLDRALALWRRISPLAALAAVPLGLLVSRTLLPRRKILGPLLRWGPVLFNALRSLGALAKTPSGPAQS